jgi:PAS domain S-box-containing protein
MAGLSLFALVLFFHTFPFQNSLPRSKPFFLLVSFAIFMSLASTASPWIVASAINTPRGRVLTYGPLYPAFALYTFSCIGYSLSLLLKKARRARGLERQQLRYIFFALLVPGLLAIFTNLVVPLATGRSHLSPYGPLLSVMMVALIAHAIIRHRLMNVRLVVRRGAVYLIAATITAAFLASALFVADRLTGGRADDAPLEVQVAVGLLVALAFQPLKARTQRWLDRYVYRQEYDYSAIIREASRTIASILDLTSLLNYLCEITIRTLRPDLVAIYIRDKGSGSFSLAAHRSQIATESTPCPLSLDPGAPLPAFLLSSRRSLLRHDLVRTQTNDSIEAVTHLSQLGGDVALPMLSENHLIGFLILGPKMSGDVYFAEDLDLFTTLANQAAIAVNNAQLYGRVLLANEYIENILRTMDSGVITVDATGRVALFNSTAERLTGLSRTGLTMLDVDRLPNPLASQLRATLNDGQPRLQVETTLPAGDRRIPVVCSTSALTDNTGTILGGLVVFSDLTKLKALENEKRRAERLASFGALAKGFAHEIKNPLVAIKTFAELLPERFTDPDFREEFAKVVIKEISRIDDLVARLRGIAAPIPEHVGAVDIREPIGDVLALLRGQLEQTRTGVSREFLDDTPYVAVEHSQLKQLFLNLLMNAIEAIGTGGQITIRVTRRHKEGAAWIATEVSDTGPGIPESLRANIFDPFFTTKPRGSGLGLAICRGIADAHRGVIRAENRRDRSGTVMIVEFPAAVIAPYPATENVLRG